VGVPVLLLLLLGSIVEITVLVLVGQAIGVLPTILLLIAASVVGMWLLRREGARTFAAFQQAMRERRVPQRELADGFILGAAGVLILLPGFVSDVLALGLLFPPTRALLTRRMARTPAQQPEVFVVDSVVVRDNEIERYQ
jgi:UPF0716 protein FxsA